MQNYGAVDPGDPQRPALLGNGGLERQPVRPEPDALERGRLAIETPLCRRDLPIRVRRTICCSVLSEAARPAEHLQLRARGKYACGCVCMIELLTQKLPTWSIRCWMSNPVGLKPSRTRDLQWTAGRQGIREIAIILSISRARVSFHPTRTSSSTPNKTLAATYAAALGLI